MIRETLRTFRRGFAAAIAFISFVAAPGMAAAETVLTPATSGRFVSHDGTVVQW